LRSRRPIAPLAPLLRKEIRELATGNPLWVLMLLLSPLVGYSFIQAVALYAEASRPALSIPELARQLSPFDGILVPTLGGFYLAITLLFPFIAIRLVASEKASGGLKLLVQLPYRLTGLVAAKFAALTLAWLVALIPVLSALAGWAFLGGHLDIHETATLLLGHLLYAALIGAIAFLAAALTEGGATAAILALAVTLGSWVLDFAALDRGGVSSVLASLSLTALLRPFEQGLLSIPNILAMLIATAGLLALTAIWLPPGTSLRRKLSGSALIIGAAGILIGGAAQAAIVLDVTADRREIVMTYDGRSATTRSTGAGEMLPILYDLARVSSPAPGTTGSDEPGYPLVADASNSAVWFYGVEPFAFAAAWWFAAGNRRIRWRRF